MKREYNNYPANHFETIRPFVLACIVERVSIKTMAEELGMKHFTLSSMMHRNGVSPVSIRYKHSKGEDVFK